ncbi:MAG: hypothetical protein SVT56_13435, partial [Chloroflexota bacterium]|nr:hypothetical protein [Chloroflexota bacterium]
RTYNPSIDKSWIFPERYKQYEGDRDGYASTYPRPWFGFFDQNSGSYYTWGGYNPSVQAKSGFRYEGRTGTVIGSVNPADVTVGWVDFDFDQNKLNVNGWPDEVNYVLYKKDAPRPLVNGEWLDASLVFLPDGTVDYRPFGQARAVYNNMGTATVLQDVMREPGRTFHYDKPSAGVLDRSWFADVPLRTSSTDAFYGRNEALRSIDDGRMVYNDEFEHFVARTGYWFVTLGSDVDIERYDDAQFDSVQSVIEHFGTLIRVGVSANGVVRIVDVDVNGDLPEGKQLWDGSDGRYSEVGESSLHFQHMRRDGSLHKLNDPAQPLGEPIVDRVTKEMLTLQRWWMK